MKIADEGMRDDGVDVLGKSSCLSASSETLISAKTSARSDLIAIPILRLFSHGILISIYVSPDGNLRSSYAWQTGDLKDEKRFERKCTI